MPTPVADYLNPQTLARLGRLEIIARAVVEGFIAGLHRSPYKGFSVEFAEHRPYVPGDEIRHIDWHAWGKTDRYYVKEYEEETNLRAWLVVDASGSMRYAGGSLQKFLYARNLAAALAYLMLHQRDAVGLVTFDTDIRAHIPPRSSAPHFRVLAEAIEATRPGDETALGRILHHLADRLKRRALVILISDFFDDPAELKLALRHLRHKKHEVILLHVLAPEEVAFPFRRWTQFRNLERDAHRLLVDPQRLRPLYLERFRRFCQDLADSAAEMHIDYQRMLTDQPYDVALGLYLTARARRRH